MCFLMANVGMLFRADMRQYVGPPTVAAIAQMLKGGVEVNTILQLLEGDDVEDVTPFSGGLVLPTRLQLLKLHLFFKDEAGRGNHHVTPALGR